MAARSAVLSHSTASRASSAGRGPQSPAPARQKVLDGHRRVLNRATPGEKAAARAWLMKRGQVPTDAAVATAVAEARRRAQFEAWKQTTERNIDEVGRRAADLVARALASRGMAPTWRELGQVMGWRYFCQRVWVVPLLEQAGWLTTGPEPRSLRPGPKAVGAGA